MYNIQYSPFRRYQSYLCEGGYIQWFNDAEIHWRKSAKSNSRCSPGDRRPGMRYLAQVYWETWLPIKDMKTGYKNAFLIYSDSDKTIGTLLCLFSTLLCISDKFSLARLQNFKNLEKKRRKIQMIFKTYM